MTYRFARYEKRDHIGYITINRPESMNALHPDASRELRTIFEDFRDDPDTWVAIITGAGKRSFCAGFDLKYAASRTKDDPARTVPLGGITRDWECWKPIIAAINGYALGGGLELVLACDIAVAAEHAELGLPEVRVGLAPGAGGPHRMIRAIGDKRTMGLMLTGRRISAAEALQMGLLNEVVSANELMAAAERWAEMI
ncbi:MAG: enoyl-CoA hydratase-related protein, partial [Pirellulaceae bacterium]|nr:enoyl-CoA hydratase-related protein [Pirellulaceae bacterium]